MGGFLQRRFPEGRFYQTGASALQIRQGRPRPGCYVPCWQFHVKALVPENELAKIQDMYLVWSVLIGEVRMPSNLWYPFPHQQ
jgi:hypothetical protein